MAGFLINMMMFLPLKANLSMTHSSKKSMIGTTPTLHPNASRQDKQIRTPVPWSMLNIVRTDTQDNGKPRQRDSDR